ncbi:hypothetical protein HD806DRAFT_523335 [Xylariaceae sp. AK1471]|nr:hypothetical protein HD806DRAFT_523335 [Xylariaceae sp. AK1471]
MGMLPHSQTIIYSQSLQATAGWHTDWTLGATLFGGSVAAPDIQSLHLIFLRPCERYHSAINVTVLKTGNTISKIQLLPSQNNQIKIVALATSTNFAKVIGRTTPTAWALLPPPNPTPHFAQLPAHLSGEIISLTRSFLILSPRGYGYRTEGDHINANYLSMMTDVVPSMSDTLLHNEAEEHPGVPVDITNWVAEAMQATPFNSTVTLNIEFRRRIPEGGLRCEGRMDIDVTLCNDKMGLLCTAHQLILVLEAQRKFRTGKTEPSLRRRQQEQ